MPGHYGQARAVALLPCLSVCDPFCLGFGVCLQGAGRCVIASACSLPPKKWPGCVTEDGQNLWDRLPASSMAKYVCLYCIFLDSVYASYFLWSEHF